MRRAIHTVRMAKSSKQRTPQAASRTGYQRSEFSLSNPKRTQCAGTGCAPHARKSQLIVTTITSRCTPVVIPSCLRYTGRLPPCSCLCPTRRPSSSDRPVKDRKKYRLTHSPPLLLMTAMINSLEWPRRLSFARSNR